MKAENILSGIIGVPIDSSTGEPIKLKDDHDHFYCCKQCGQAVDMRDLGQVLHHNCVEHSPLRLDS